MSSTHEIVLSSERPFGGRLPPRHLGYFLAEIPLAVQQCISMALRNRSTARGPRPSWLERASDIRYLDHESNGDTILYFDAPTLREAASELYDQQELWPTRPDGIDTGFDLLGDVLTDISTKNPDSDHFDPPLLQRVARFKKVLSGPFKEIRINSRRYSADDPAVIKPLTIDIAERLYAKTPAPQRVRLVGHLDMIRASTQTFALRLDDGQEVRGILPDGSLEECKALLGQRALILGRAIYRASGRLLRIDAEAISSGEAEPSLWSRMPQPRNGTMDLSKFRKPQGPRSGVAATLGRWPGDESDEEIRLALEKLS